MPPASLGEETDKEASLPSNSKEPTLTHAVVRGRGVKREAPEIIAVVLPWVKLFYCRGYVLERRKERCEEINRRKGASSDREESIFQRSCNAQQTFVFFPTSIRSQSKRSRKSAIQISDLHTPLHLRTYLFAASPALRLSPVPPSVCPPPPPPSYQLQKL